MLPFTPGHTTVSLAQALYSRQLANLETDGRLNQTAVEALPRVRGEDASRRKRMNPIAQIVLIVTGVGRLIITVVGRPIGLIVITIGVGQETAHHGNVVNPLNAPGRLPAQNILAHRKNFLIFHQTEIQI